MAKIQTAVSCKIVFYAGSYVLYLGLSLLILDPVTTVLILKQWK